MALTRRALVGLGIILMAAGAAAKATERERKDVPDRYKWNLADLYPADAAWTKAKEAAARRLPSLAAHRGKLGQSAQDMLAALQAMFELDRELSRLAVYANSLSDEDVRAPRPRQMKQEAEELVTAFAAACSWVRPEILSLDPAKARAFLAQEPRLAPYRMFLEETLRRKPHTLSAGEERIAAQAGELERTGSEVHGVLSNADLPYPTIKLSTGQSVRLDAPAFSLHRQARVRADRDKVFAGFFGALKTYERTMGSTLASAVKAHLFEKRVRHFNSTLEAALFPDNIPTAVYKQLLADVHRSLPTLHRYLALRQRMLGLDVLRYQDLYVPLVASVDMRFEPDEARALTLEALAPLGKPYTDALQKGFESRWTDYLPSPGKRSGAYSTGVYGVHPYQLLNFNGRYDDLTTLAHESGHSMHTFLSHGAQPYPTADYPIFVAEVASTFNENLLIHFMLDWTKDDASRLFLLGTLLDGLRTTLFRQTQYPSSTMHDVVARQLGADAQQPVHVRPRARAAAARLDAEQIVQQRDDEVVVQVVVPVAHHERHDRQPLGAQVAQQAQVRVLLPGGDGALDEAALHLGDGVVPDRALELERQPGADRFDDRRRAPLLAVLLGVPVDRRLGRHQRRPCRRPAASAPCS